MDIGVIWGTFIQKQIVAKRLRLHSIWPEMSRVCALQLVDLSNMTH